MCSSVSRQIGKFVDAQLVGQFLGICSLNDVNVVLEDLKALLLLISIRWVGLVKVGLELLHRSEERREGKSVDLGGRRIIKKKKTQVTQKKKKKQI